MYCRFCGKQIADDNAFCQYCGKPTAQEDGLAKLVAEARTGSQDAISALYEKTYSKVYYTVKSMIKDEDAVFDIVQDTYIKAFAHLDGFQGDTKFLPWVRQIAANTARDWLKKKRPMLFTELGSGDEQEIPVEEMFPDERVENIPEQVIDQEETKRLLREIIEELPEDQRAVIGMFYYEEMSVKEIAAAMDASESAVKSRLMYGRNKIEKKVRELEKKGTKLYGLAPVAFLLLLFRSQEAHAASAPDGRILQNILASRSAGVGMTGNETTGSAPGGETPEAASGTTTGTGTAGTAQGAGSVGGSVASAAGVGTAGAAAAGGLGAVKIGLIALAATAAVGLGGYGATRMLSRSDESKEVPVVEDASGQGGETGTPEELEMSEETEALEEPSPIDEALEQYRIIVSQADSYDYEQTDDVTWEFVGYGYALVRMNPEDTVPTLLLRSTQDDPWWHGNYDIRIRLFQYDPETKTVCQPDGVISAGGVRSSLGMAGDGYGIFFLSWSGSAGDAHVTRYTLAGDTINQETYWSGNIFEIPDYISFSGIDWYEIENLSPLDSWVEPVIFTGPEDENCTSYVIPEGVTKISTSAFAGCEELTSVEIPAGVMKIGDEAFSECTSLTSIEIPASVTEIGRDAFSGCSSLSSISLPQGLDITEVGIPDSTEIIWTTPDAEGAEQTDQADSGALPADGDRIVLTGTVCTLDYDEIVVICPDIYADTYDDWAWEFMRSQTYPVILLDTPQTLSLHSGGFMEEYDDEKDRYGSDEVLMIDLKYTDSMDQYEGQHITFSIDPASTYWPTSGDVPYGQPHTSDIHVLE